jgi:hypothetical protein
MDDNTTSIIVLATPVFQALAVPASYVVATIVGLAIWRYQMIAKRQYEIAEQVLQAANAAAQAIRSARLRPNDEKLTMLPISDASTEKEEKSTVQRLREKYALPAKRLDGSMQAFTDLAKMQGLCEMHHGVDAAQPFSEFFDVRTQIRSVAITLISLTNRGSIRYQRTPEEQQTFNAGMRVLYYHEDRPDPISQRIDAAHAKLKERYGKYLRPSRLSMFFPFL